MLIFPQLSTGALVQYPVRKRRTERSIVNVSEDGHVIALYDEYARQVQWDLSYSGLTDAETASLVTFFGKCEGSLQPFTFLDPTENLFAYSQDLSQSAWTYNSLLRTTPGIDDPIGGTGATRLGNTSGAALTVAQTVPFPGSVTCTFSVYLRCAAGATITLMRGDGSTTATNAVQATSAWVRFSMSNAFASSISQNCTFSISVPTGTTVDVFGFQLEAQPSAGRYVMSTNETGIYSNCRFNMSELPITSTGPGQSSTKLSILSKASQ